MFIFGFRLVSENCWKNLKNPHKTAASEDGCGTMLRRQTARQRLGMNWRRYELGDDRSHVDSFPAAPEISAIPPHPRAALEVEHLASEDRQARHSRRSTNRQSLAVPG